MKRISSSSLYIIPILLALIASTSAVYAQNKVTFKVNLKPQLEDSIFVPGRDVALLSGNLSPLSSTNRLQMTDGTPADSIYSVEVNFPYTALNKNLTYNFILKTPDREIKETRPRIITIRNGDRELNPLQFDTFAW